MALGLGAGVGAGDQTQHRVDGHDGGTAVADQRQSQTDNGHHTDTHADVDHHLEGKCRGSAEADDAAHIVGTFHTHHDAPGDDAHLQQHDHDAAKEA